MSAPWGILLVPHPEHREALLGEGPCGARAPQAYLSADGRWKERRSAANMSKKPGRPVPGGLDYWRRRSAANMSKKPHALVLAWEGRCTPTGALYACPVGDGNGFAWLDVWDGLEVELAGQRNERLRYLLDDLGTLILIDANGHEVTP